MSGIAKVPPSPILNQTVTSGLLNVGPGSNPPASYPDSTKGKVAGVWGYLGPLVEAPSQTSQPPLSCAVYAQGGVLGVNGYSGTIAETDSDGDGVVGFGETNGVHGIAAPGNGVHGVNGAGSGTKPAYGCGVFGESDNGYGVYGASTTGSAVYGKATAPHLAGEFDGNVQMSGTMTSSGITSNGAVKINGTATVTGDVILSGADCAEQFDMQDASSPEPGTIVVIDDEGKLRESQGAYDKRVAGVVSGAGEYKPAIVLDRRGSSEGRASIALVGKVYCKVDADPAPITVGDLLTTSTRPGFAMKAADPAQAFGAVIGKALRPLRSGQGLIPILVALQ